MKHIVFLFLVSISLLNASCTQRWSAEEKQKAKKDCILHPYGEFVAANFKIAGRSGQTKAELDSIQKALATKHVTSYCNCLMNKLSRKISYEDYKSGLAVMDSSYSQAADECDEESWNSLEK